MPTQQEPGGRTYVLAMNGHRVVVGARKLTIDGIPVILTPTQQDILYTITAREGHTIADHELTGSDADAHRTTVSVHLHHIRSVFQKVTDNTDLFHLVTSVGHRLHRVPFECYESPKVDMPVQHACTIGGARVVLYENGVLTVNGTGVHTTKKELAIFRFLAEREGKVCTKVAMLTGIYGEDRTEWPEYKILDVFVCKLRSKLGAVHEDARGLIYTTWGRGYALDPNPPKVVHEGSLKPDLNSRNLSVSDLPPSNCRWVIKRKAVVVRLLSEGKVQMSELHARYPNMTEAEVASWKGDVQRGGLLALRTTRIAA